MESLQRDELVTDEFISFTKGERIQQLNSVDKSLNRLLMSAGKAIQTLSTTQSLDDHPKLDRRQQFEENCQSYLRTLQNIDVALHRQIYGLEEADIIPADKQKTKIEKKTESHLKSNVPIKLPLERSVTAQEIPKNYDIGLLYSQSGRVGRDLEAELWEKARTLLEGLDNGSLIPGPQENSEN
ncbi:hypothetical protein GcC1_058021 [Golovinomyces cichoracearum]|uniref:Mediator of RNA polymerase II transcription subunit 11 n=1 Tax=Golovinomyces cichoracearum TaxID=62708 RepID=A0A420IU96_9PEZI|nr:hypothetical protein GcC1_058021 [Golovinomyces cichoracearum]